jgi:phosphoglycolate phosphatase
VRAAYLDLDGTLLGPDGVDAEAHAALRRLRAASVPYVLVSGRALRRLAVIARELGAAGALPELGATDAGFPVTPGQSVFAAIAASGVPEALLAAEPELARHPHGAGREGGHVFRGRVGPGAGAWVESRSGGRLRLVDNGASGADGSRVVHLLPAGAGKGAAVARDIARRRADPARCLAVGDSLQDLEMGAVLGRIAIVANGARSDPAVAAAAPWVTRGAYGAGVLEAVDAWLG